MSDTVLERNLFAKCRVVATLTRTGQGIGWPIFLENAFAKSLITEICYLYGLEAIVGHADSLADLQTYIQRHARNSYRLGQPVQLQPLRLARGGVAKAKIKKQTSSADKFADLTLEVTPLPETSSVRLIVPQSPEVPRELHAQEVADAILGGVCIASVAKIEKPLVGFQVCVKAAKWNDVDSSSGLFRRVAAQAMAEILSKGHSGAGNSSGG